MELTTIKTDNNRGRDCLSIKLDNHSKCGTLIVWCCSLAECWLRCFLQNLNAPIYAIISFLVAAHASYATPERWSLVTDQLLWVSEDRYVVLRTTDLGFSSHYQRLRTYERVDLSVWDARVLDRCVLGIQDARDESSEGDWTITETAADNNCSPLPNSEVSFPVPLLRPGTQISLLRGTLELRVGSAPWGVLADQQFVLSRLRAMLAAERAACENQSPGWPMFGGCFLAEDASVCAVHRTVWATEQRLFFQILCDDPDASFTDLDASRTWVTIGRQYWDARFD